MPIRLPTRGNYYLKKPKISTEKRGGPETVPEKPETKNGAKNHAMGWDVEIQQGKLSGN